MMRLPLIIIGLLAALVAGCRTHKEVRTAETRVISDTLSVLVTKNSTANAENIRFFNLRSDSLGLRFTADSIRAGDVTVYGPEIVAAARGADLAQGSQEMTEAADSAAVRAEAASDRADDRHTDLRQDTETGPSAGDFIKFALFFVILGLSGLVVRKLFAGK